MKEYEYFDLGADVFMKVHEGGDIIESLKKPKSEWPNVVINRFNGRKSYIITEEEQNEDMETVEAMASNGDETKTYDIANTDNLIVTENEEPDPVFVEPANNNKSLKEESTKRYILPEEPIDIIYNPDKNFDPEKLGLQIVEGDKPKKESKKKKSKEPDDFLTAVKKPSHYQDITIKGANGEMTFEAIEIIDSIIDMLDFNPATSHAIGDGLKYILRCGKKDSDNNSTTDLLDKAKQDLLKSSWYLERASKVL